MLDLFLIIILIISLAKPDILLALFESLAIMRYSTIIGFVLVIIFFILFFTISWPATKQNKQIIKDLEI